MLLNEKEFLIGDKMDKKLILLCRLHDEICEIGKSINAMFSFQMLLTMAYGFMSTTAQFYFLYCGLMGQVSIFDQNIVDDIKKKLHCK
jgi:gustatory receptor